MNIWKKIALAFFLMAVPAVAQTVYPIQNWCQLGGKGVVTQGMKSSGTYTLPTSAVVPSTGVQASYPNCRVTVFDTGTSTKPTIYANTSHGAKTNPFFANNDGSYLLFAAAGCYDVVTDQGSMPVAHTDTDVCIGGAGTPGTGTVTSVNPATDVGTAGALGTFGFSNQTTTPVLTFNLLNAPAHSVWGNGTGSSAAPGYFSLGTGDLPFTYSGDQTKLATVSSSFSGTGAICRDGSGNLTTSGCTGSGVTSFNTRTGDVTPQTGDYTVSMVTGAAALASPTFTGVPRGPTAAPGATGTQLATLDFVLANGAVSSVFGRTGPVVAVSGDYDVTEVTGAAPLASPTFTGVPLAPTAGVDTSTTQIATTAFVVNQPSHGLVLTAAGLGVPSPLATSACPTGQGVSQYLLNASAQYQDIQSLDNTTVGPPTSPAGTINNCWRTYWNNSGAAMNQMQNEFIGIVYSPGQGGVTSNATTQSRAIGAVWTNEFAGSSQDYNQENTIYTEFLLSGTTSNFHGHSGGEVDGGGIRVSLNDERTGFAGTAPNMITSFSSQMTVSGICAACMSTSSGRHINFRAYSLYTASGAITANQEVDGFYADGAGNTGGATGGLAYYGFQSQAPTNRFPQFNAGFYSGNFGTNASDFDFVAAGVNSAGTPAGFSALVGPTFFGTQAHVTAGYQVELLGAMKLKAGAGVRQLDLFGSTSGSCGWSTDATSTTISSTCPIALTGFNHSGTSQTASHIVRDRCTLGTDCSVTLAGSAVFTSSSTYDCAALDRTAAAAIQFAPSSGSAFALTGTGTDTISYICVGN